VIAEPLQRFGTTHQVAVLCELDGGIDDVLRDDGAPIAVDPELAAGGQAHLDAALAAAPGTWNGEILGFRSFGDDVITAGRTDYFTMLATSDALSAERARLGGDGPLRARAVALAGGDPTRSGAGRASVVGVSTLVTVAHGGAEWLVLGRRSGGLAVSPGLVGTIDGCSEPGSTARPLAGNVIRELEEEAPGLVALMGSGAREEIRGRARLLGVTMNLLRFSPSITVGIRIESPRPPVAEGLLSPHEFASAILVEATPAGLEQVWREQHLLAPPAAGALALWERRAGGRYL
jgi:hypothetical protein